MTTKTKSGIINIIHDIANVARQRGIAHLYTEDDSYNGRTIKIEGKVLINFGSCSYLGLEIDERLKEGAIDSIRRYGIQFSSSRSYVSCTLYTEWEGLIREMFNAPIVLPATTTLGHHAVIPVVVEEGDLIIMDQQVHASVQDAALKMQLKGITVTVVRHNRLDELEAKIIESIPLHNNIWYMADGIYSMYGDFAPIEELVQLLKRYKPFHIYMDDSHGMSIMGKNGTGYVMSKVGIQDKMIIACSFAKAFGAGGAVIVFPNEELARKVKNCGGPMVFSGPHQIPVIGAGIASARIHLSDEIDRLQTALKERLTYCHALLLKYNLPVTSNPETPIFFIGLGLTKVGYNMVKRMVEDGCYVNLGIFPAVPETCTGLRFTITNHHTFADIEYLTERLAYHLPKALHDEGRTLQDISRAFRKVIHFKEQAALLPDPVNQLIPKYSVQHETTIKNIPEERWNNLLGNKGAFDWKELDFLEKTFRDNTKPEHNWNFHYYLIYDADNQPVLATFFTHCLTKDDMLSAAAVSEKIETERQVNPYYLCSTTFMMGCLLSEGEHLYIDRTRPDWKNIMMIFLDAIWKEQEHQKANCLNLRDFDANDLEMQEFLCDQGFIRMAIPDSHTIEALDFEHPKDYLQQLNGDKRYYLNRKVLNQENEYHIKIVNDISEADPDYYFQLYKNVASQSFEINVFPYPKRFFRNIFKHSQWEVIEIYLKAVEKPVGIALCYKTKNIYHFLITGINYNYQEQHVYPQVLWQIIVRANQLKLKTVDLGLTASQNKRKFGAKPVSKVVYVQLKDSYNMSIINSIANNAQDSTNQKRLSIRRTEILKKNLKMEEK